MYKLIQFVPLDIAQESVRQAFMPFRVRRERNQPIPVRPEFVEGRLSKDLINIP